ncbi:MAG TPA: dihydroorotase [Myxococcales bacterium]|nr:dihydroorotase [Myxococcales bacterium]HIK84580.1 dihydroorotase [Myxococcales bacterium]
MARLLIRNGRLLDPSQDLDGALDCLVEDGRIARIDVDISADGAEILDAEGAWIAPGLIDIHTHLREPGQEYKEDLASGGMAAVAGGFTQLACMANTDPVNDDPSVTKYILDRAEKDSPVKIRPIAAATRGLAGQVMTEMMALREAGAVAFSDDGATIMDTAVMRRVLEYSTLADAPVIVHAEDCHLRAGGVVNEGPVSTRLGLPGNPAAAEEIMIARDLRLAAMTGAHLHIAHVSSAGSVDLIRRAREDGTRVTAEVTPHHLSLTDEATMTFDTSTRVAPPLRSAADISALRAALAEGVIDVMATDHAPHATYEKEVEFTEAPPGMLGLETAVAVTLDLVRDGTLSPLEFVRCWSTNPAELIAVEGGSLRVGSAADIVLIDPTREWTYDAAQGFSKSRNSPWSGSKMTGRAVATIVDGRLVYHSERGVLIR